MKTELKNIAATPEGLYEYEADKILIFVKKSEIKKLSFGFVAPVRWPLVSVLLGTLLIGVGIFFGVVPLIRAITSSTHGLPTLKGYAYIFLNVFPGVYFLMLGLRKKNCLIVETNKGITKLIIKELVEDHEAVNFINETTKLFDHPV